MKPKASALREAADAGPPPAELFEALPASADPPAVEERPSAPTDEARDAGPPAPELVAAMERAPEPDEDEDDGEREPDAAPATLIDAGAPPEELHRIASSPAPVSATAGEPPGEAAAGGGCVACG